MRTPVFLSALAVLLVLQALVPAQTSRAGLHSAFDRLLAANVRNERIDYLTVDAKWLPELDRYLDTLAGVDDTKLPRKERMAFLFNLYNATMIRAVVERHRHGWRPSENDYGVFKEPLVRLNGKRVSLNQLENEIIRPTFKDPRIHVALVCGAVSCPPLIPRAYRADDLDQVLDANLKRFVNDPKRNPVDAGSRTIRLSRIFDWYADDFGGKGALLAYVSRHHSRRLDGYQVAFSDYDWKLNITQPAAGRWVTVTARHASYTDLPGGGDKARAAKGEVLAVLEERGGALRVRRPRGQGEAWIAARDTGPWSLPTR